MMRRIAVVGDELSSVGRILPYEQKHGFTFHGHMTALIGGDAYCEKCKSVGLIAKAGGPYRPKYGAAREAALDGDIVLCNCPTPSRIIAKLSQESWCSDKAEHYETIARQAALLAAGTNDASHHDEQFTLRDARARALAATYYTIRFTSGFVVHGITDGLGRTARYKTNGAQNIALYLGHKER